MARSWMIVDENGERRHVDVRALTRQGVLAAVRRAVKAGRNVVEAWKGGPHAIALSSQVYPPRRPA